MRHYTTEIMPVDLNNETPFRLYRQAALPDNDVIYLHYHDCFEIGLCTSGESIFVTDNHLEYTGPNTITLLASHTPHLQQSVPGTLSSWIWFYFDFKKLLLPYFFDLDLAFLDTLSERRFSCLKTVGENDDMRLLLESFYRESGNRYLAAALGMLIVNRIRRIFEALPPESRRENHDARGEDTPCVGAVSRTLAFFGANYTKPVSIAETAKLCGMSHNNFRRVFKMSTGLAPLDYLNQFRCRIAKSLLLSSHMPIAQIALRCGYESLSSFNRQFKRHVGMSPREYVKSRTPDGSSHKPRE